MGLYTGTGKTEQEYDWSAVPVRIVRVTDDLCECFLAAFDVLAGGLQEGDAALRI